MKDSIEVKEADGKIDIVQHWSCGERFKGDHVMVVTKEAAKSLRDQLIEVLERSGD